MTTSVIPPAVRAILPQTFLANVPEEIATSVLAAGRQVDVAPGGILRHTKAKPGIAIVVEGLVRSFLTSAQGRQVTVRYTRPGETMGIVQLLRGRIDVNAQAVTPTILWALSPRRLRALAEQSAPLAMALAEDCAVRVADTIDELAQVTFGSVRQRLARHLLDLAASESDDGQLIARVTPRSLADATGSVREVVARALKELHAIGATSPAPAGGGIVILDAARLDDEARGDVSTPTART